MGVNASLPARLRFRREKARLRLPAEPAGHLDEHLVAHHWSGVGDDGGHQAAGSAQLQQDAVLLWEAGDDGGTRREPSQGHLHMQPFPYSSC